jgi:hypothetical protein
MTNLGEGDAGRVLKAVAKVFNKGSEREQSKKSSCRAFSRHCPCEHGSHSHGLCCSQRKKNTSSER